MSHAEPAAPAAPSVPANATVSALANAVAAPPFRHRLRVYWEDTDAGGVVFYANHLKFFERARTEWLRGLGIGQQALRERTGAIFVVIETRVRYRAPARLDDELDITVEPRRLASASLTVAQQAWCGATLVADGEIRVGCVDAGTFRPRRIPNEVIQHLQ